MSAKPAFACRSDVGCALPRYRTFADPGLRSAPSLYASLPAYADAQAFAEHNPPPGPDASYSLGGDVRAIRQDGEPSQTPAKGPYTDEASDRDC